METMWVTLNKRKRGRPRKDDAKELVPKPPSPPLEPGSEKPEGGGQGKRPRPTKDEQDQRRKDKNRDSARASRRALEDAVTDIRDVMREVVGHRNYRNKAEVVRTAAQLLRRMHKDLRALRMQNIPASKENVEEPLLVPQITLAPRPYEELPPLFGFPSIEEQLNEVYS